MSSFNSLNKVMLMGRVGRDPEKKYINSGTAVCNFSLATSESFKIGDQFNFGGVGFNGYIDEFRYVEGKAVWTSGFTPPCGPHNLPEPGTVGLILLGGLGLLKKR